MTELSEEQVFCCQVLHGGGGGVNSGLGLRMLTPELGKPQHFFPLSSIALVFDETTTNQSSLFCNFGVWIHPPPILTFQAALLAELEVEFEHRYTDKEKDFVQVPWKNLNWTFWREVVRFAVR